MIYDFYLHLVVRAASTVHSHRHFWPVIKFPRLTVSLTYVVMLQLANICCRGRENPVSPCSSAEIFPLQTERKGKLRHWKLGNQCDCAKICKRENPAERRPQYAGLFLSFALWESPPDSAPPTRNTHFCHPTTLAKCFVFAEFHLVHRPLWRILRRTSFWCTGTHTHTHKRVPTTYMLILALWFMHYISVDF